MENNNFEKALKLINRLRQKPIPAVKMVLYESATNTLKFLTTEDSKESAQTAVEKLNLYDFNVNIIADKKTFFEAAEKEFKSKQNSLLIKDFKLDYLTQITDKMADGDIIDPQIQKL